jgi:uncharacterized membrane protein YqjE
MLKDSRGNEILVLEVVEGFFRRYIIIDKKKKSCFWQIMMFIPIAMLFIYLAIYLLAVLGFELRALYWQYWGLN